MSAFLPGDSVTWFRVVSGGYGDGGAIPAVVVRVGKVRVTIDAELRAGGTKRIGVLPVHLKLRHSPEHSR